MESQHPLAVQKSLLRKELRQKLNELSAKERLRRSKEIVERLFTHPKFISARTLFTYIAKTYEVETQPIMEGAVQKGKTVYVPRVDPGRKKIWMIEFTGQEKLEPNQYGILEPPFLGKQLGDPKELDLAVIPGLGFDRRGGRIGRGEGYFDRFLKEAKNAYKVGLAFECQMVKKIPEGNHDIKVDEVLTG